MPNLAAANQTADLLIRGHAVPNTGEASDQLRELAFAFKELRDGARMRMVIERLFADAARERSPDGKVDDTQAPALEVHILLRSGAPIQFSGVLSTTPEGTLKLMTIVPATAGNKAQMIESFFDYADVTSVALVREIKATPSSLIHTS